MSNDSNTFHDFLDQLQMDSSALETTLKTLGLSAWPLHHIKIPDNNSPLQKTLYIAENAFKHSSLIANRTSGLTANQFLLTLADQNSINSALIFMNIALTKTLLESIDKLNRASFVKDIQGRD